MHDALGKSQSCAVPLSVLLHVARAVRARLPAAEDREDRMPRSAGTLLRTASWSTHENRRSSTAEFLADGKVFQPATVTWAESAGLMY